MQPVSETVFIGDFGKKLTIVDPKSGEIPAVEMFQV